MSISRFSTPVYKFPRLTGLSLVLVCLTATSFPLGNVLAQTCGTQPCSTSEGEPTEIVVKLAAGAFVQKINERYKTVVVDSVPSLNVYVLTSTEGRDMWSLLDAVEDERDVLYAEVNYPIQVPEASPYSSWAHPYSSWAHPYSSWAHSDQPPTPYVAQAAMIQINIPANRTNSNGRAVVVAVLDTGIDLNHPALAGRLTTEGYDFVDDDADPNEAPNGLDDDDDGSVDEMAGHGTFVAGLVTLVAPDAQIMALRVLDSDGVGRAFLLAEAIQYAVQHGADVINVSLSTPYYSRALENALKDANRRGVVVVAAAGNDNADRNVYPAAGDKVVSVTAVDESDNKAAFANFGSLVNLSAPGVNVHGPLLGGDYAIWSGTSMATPLVAGEAALLMGLTVYADKADDVVVCLEKGTVKVGEGQPVYGGKLGKGRIDVSAALLCYQDYAKSHPNKP